MTDPASSPALGAQPDRASTVPDDTTAALGILANNGIKGSDAGTLLKSVLQSVATFKDGDGRVHYASPVAPATVKAVASGEWSEVDVDDTFDPTKARVRDVLQYLRENAADDVEVDRVKAAEAAGEDRPTIRDWQPGQ